MGNSSSNSSSSSSSNGKNNKQPHWIYCDIGHFISHSISGALLPPSKPGYKIDTTNNKINYRKIRTSFCICSGFNGFSFSSLWLWDFATKYLEFYYNFDKCSFPFNNSTHTHTITMSMIDWWTCSSRRCRQCVLVRRYTFHENCLCLIFLMEMLTSSMSMILSVEFNDFLATGDVLKNTFQVCVATRRNAIETTKS